MTDEQKEELTEKGVILTRDKFYKTVVPRLDDSQRSVLHNERFVLMMNFPYEHFRYIVNWPGPSTKNAILLMQKGIESSKARGAKFAMLSTKSWLCSNLVNLGAFQIKLTLDYSMPWDEDVKKEEKTKEEMARIAEKEAVLMETLGEMV